MATILPVTGFHPGNVGSILYMVPYLGGRRDLAFEWAIRGTGNRAGGTVQPAN